MSDVPRPTWSASAPTRTALTGVRVFDGRQLSEPSTVVIDGPILGTDPTGAEVIDAAGAILLPGLIDAHIHLHDVETLRQLAAYGVTTGLDMGCWPPERVASLRNQPGVTDIRSAGLPIIGPGGMHATFVPSEAIIHEPGQAKQQVADRIAGGCDYVKIVAEAPGKGGPDQATLDALVIAAHEAGKKVVVHATAAGAYVMALDAGADMITHVPLDRPLNPDEVELMVSGTRIVIPTLTVAQAIASVRPGVSTAAGSQSVGALHAAGVPVLAGTDANSQPGVPFEIRHGESLHRELALLVDAGLSTVDALRAATVLPARHFGLSDRGAVAPGLRADLVLIDGDPLADITATRNIRRIWCGGSEVQPANG